VLFAAAWGFCDEFTGPAIDCLSFLRGWKSRRFRRSPEAVMLRVWMNPEFSGRLE
jgi:hypothetical protein